MKHFFVKFLAVTTASLILFSCSSGLSDEQKAMNTFKNTTLIMMGGMLAMMPVGAEAAMDGFKTQVDSALTNLEENKSEVYNQIVSNQVFIKAATIAPESELPDGLKPLSEDLTSADIMAHIKAAQAVTQATTENGDVYSKYLESISTWFNDVNTELNKYPEIMEAFKGE